MTKKIAVLLLSIIALAVAAMAGSKNPVVGGQEMYPTKDIIDNAVNSADHTTLVAAVKAAGLVDTLKGCRSPYCFCFYECSVCQAASGHIGEPVEARKQGRSEKSSDLSRCGWETQRHGLEEADQGWQRTGDAEDGERRHARRCDVGRECCPKGRESADFQSSQFPMCFSRTESFT